MTDQSRRRFLIRSCQAAGIALIPPPLLAFDVSNNSPKPSRTDFHLHPHYRVNTPLDATLLKVRAGSDQFITERHAAEIEAILHTWSSGLRKSPRDLGPIERSLAPELSACSLSAAEAKKLRSGAIEAEHRIFSAHIGLDRSAFVAQLSSFFPPNFSLLTAEFQVTAIVTRPDRVLQTRILYELVSTGPGFHREQRVGHWEIEWWNPEPGYSIRQWRAVEETWSRAASPIFADISSVAFGSVDSYRDQMLHGSDYWRTVLDGASGIDIYGHNGVSVGDINNDAYDDLYVCQPAGLPNRLYRNRGDGTFEDITGKAGVGVLENTACALFADINNDGQQDLIVVRTDGPALFLNQGDGTFSQKPDAFKFSSPPQGTFTGAAIADYDGDGWLDIYFCLYTYYQGTDQYKYPTPYFDAQNGPPNFLMRNNRDGTFRDVTTESGLSKNNTRYSFCCGWADYNQHGWPDLYVVNDFGRKNLYRNNGDGTFSDVANAAGTEDVGAGMSVCWLDYDNDSAEDLYVANMWTAPGERIASQSIFQQGATQATRALYRKHAMGNSLLRNDGKVFQDSTVSAGVGNGRWAWSSDSWDFDHDGFADLYVANGMISGPSREDLNSFFWRQVVANSPQTATSSHDYEQGWIAINELIRSDGTWSGYERNVFYANNGDGTFTDISGAVGLDFLQDGRSFALADFDHDGRLEVFLKNRNAPQLRVLKNVMRDLPPAIVFRLEGSKSNRDAIGAVVTVETERGKQFKSVQCGSGFLSQHTKELFFGLGGTKNPVQASIRWPSGAVQELTSLPANHRIWVKEGSSSVRTEPFASENRTYPKPEGSLEQATLPGSFSTWLLAPVAAPDFEVPGLDGNRIKLSSLRGKPVLLNFWMVDSEACRQQLKLISESRNRPGAAGLQVLAVNFDPVGRKSEIRNWIRDSRIDLSILQGSDDLASVYNIVYRYLYDRHRDLEVPASFLINAEGEIVKVYQGVVERIEEDVRKIPRTPEEKVSRALPFPGLPNFQFGRNYLSYGSAFFQRGYYDEAGASFANALQSDPSSAEALYGVGSVYLQQNKNAEAQQTFERVLQLNAGYPDTFPNTWNNLGILATREQRMQMAVDCFKQALQLNPNHVIALDNLGNAYRELKQWDEAQKVLERAVAASPEDPEANYNLGMVFAQTDENTRAEEFLKNALRYRPDYPEAMNNLGILYVRTQRVEEAVNLFRESIRVAPAFDKSYLSLARVYAIDGKPEDARVILLQLLAQHPGHAQATQMLQQLQQ